MSLLTGNETDLWMVMKYQKQEKTTHNKIKIWNSARKQIITKEYRRLPVEAELLTVSMSAKLTITSCVTLQTFWKQPSVYIPSYDLYHRSPTNVTRLPWLGTGQRKWDTDSAMLEKGRVLSSWTTLTKFAYRWILWPKLETHRRKCQWEGP